MLRISFPLTLLFCPRARRSINSCGGSLQSGFGEPLPWKPLFANEALLWLCVLGSARKDRAVETLDFLCFIIYLRSSASSAFVFAGRLLSVIRGDVTTESLPFRLIVSGSDGIIVFGEIIDFRCCLRICFFSIGFSANFGGAKRCSLSINGSVFCLRPALLRLFLAAFFWKIYASDKLSFWSTFLDEGSGVSKNSSNTPPLFSTFVGSSTTGTTFSFIIDFSASWENVNYGFSYYDILAGDLIGDRNGTFEKGLSNFFKSPSSSPMQMLKAMDFFTTETATSSYCG